MGEAIYYCKIFFRSKADADAALPKVQKFFRQGVGAYDYWQSHRENRTTKEKFWADIDKKFPEVGNYLRVVGLYGMEKNNEFAGMLDFGSMSDIDDMVVTEEAAHGWGIRYSAEVWHFADWDPILDFVKRRYDADDYSWISDEYADLFDCI